MKIALIECLGGVSGNMLLGAILDAGLEVGLLESELRRLDLPDWRIESKKAVRQGLAATHVEVHHPRQDKARNLENILGILERSGLDPVVRQQSRAVFERLAAAEGRVHGMPPHQVHFHEVGAVDAIIDIVGTIVGLRMLGVREVHGSELPLGRGCIRCAHGTLPNPAPATAELLRGVPTRATGIEGELVTPTGAAILTTLARSFDFRGRMTVERIGYGAGSRDLAVPNVTRLLVAAPPREDALATDCLVQFDTFLDDLNPQVYGFVMDRLFEAGALDVAMTPVFMKKNRPGVHLTVLSPPDRDDGLLEVLLRETTTLGVRRQVVQRVTLPRAVETIETSLGSVRVKVVGRDAGDTRPRPEYEDCRRIAEERNLPLWSVIDQVEREARAAPGPSDAVGT